MVLMLLDMFIKGMITMARALIKAGICGFTTEIIATSKDMETASLTVNSECPNYKKLGDELKEIDAMTSLYSRKVGTDEVYKVCAKHCRHAACPVPCGILKTVEVACGLALPKDIIIKIEA